MDKQDIIKALTYMERWKFVPREDYVVVGEAAFVLSGIKASTPTIEIVANENLWSNLEIRFEPGIRKGTVPFNYFINWDQFKVRINNPDHRLRWEKELVDNFKVLSINNYQGTKLYAELTRKA